MHNHNAVVTHVVFIHAAFTLLVSTQPVCTRASTHAVPTYEVSTHDAVPTHNIQTFTSIPVKLSHWIQLIEDDNSFSSIIISEIGFEVLVECVAMGSHVCHC